MQWINRISSMCEPGEPDNFECIQLLFECFLVNCVFFIQAGLECSFDRVKAAMDPQLSQYLVCPMISGCGCLFIYSFCRSNSIVKSLELGSLGLLKIVAPELFMFKVHDNTNDGDDDENLFNFNKVPEKDRVNKTYLSISLNQELFNEENVPQNKKRRTKKSDKGTIQRPSLKISPEAVLKFKQCFQKCLEVKLNGDNFNGTLWVDLLQAGLLEIPETVRHPITPIVLNLCNEDLTNFADEIKRLKFYSDNIVYHRRSVARQARFAELAGLDDRLVVAVRNVNGITPDKLYCHQVQAIEALNSGMHVCVSSSTSSGKSLIYSIPMVEMLLANPNSTALLIFPTKALAEDQKLKLRILFNEAGLRNVNVETFDGDTEANQRRHVRNHAQIVITNPDMLHCAMLPHHHLWRCFLINLKYVVLDEFHVYTGDFGAHVSLVLRRFRRIAAHYGNFGFRFIYLSATINNPLKHLKSLVGLRDGDDNVELVDNDGSPSSSNDVLIWRVDGDDDTNSVAAKLLLEFINYNLRTVAFCKYRKQCEHIMKAISDINGDIVSGKLAIYRGGYLSSIRRETESSMRNAELTAVLATSALELGIDIGDINLTLHVNFPHSLSSLWQQMGRAGRRWQHSIALLLLNADQYQLDKFYLENPEEIFNQSFNSPSIDFEDSVILEQHLQCAALEKPIDTEKDADYFSTSCLMACDKVLLTSEKSPLFFCNTQLNPNPSLSFSIRGNSDDDLVGIYCQGKLLEEIEYLRSFYEVYEGAVYLHAGETYIVMQADIDRRLVALIKTAVNFITLPEFCMRPSPLGIIETRGEYIFGKLKVSCSLVKYRKFDTKRKKIIESVDVMRPRRSQFITFGIWRAFKDEEQLCAEFKSCEEYFRHGCKFGESLIIMKQENQLVIFMKGPSENSVYLRGKLDEYVANKV